MTAPLPIEPLLPELRRTLRGGRSAVLQAPPGSGKTTRVPLALLGEPWLEGRRVLLLEPRRLAARAAASRMAATLGEPVGHTVGYRIRLERRVSPATRIEVLTEGLLTRRLLGDPGLEGVGAVLFDEFHERSLQADLGLALCLEVQGALREDLRLLVMSATLDGEAVARLMGDGTPVLTGGGRLHPVETRHLERDPDGPVEDAVAAAARRALDEADGGDVLAFLPGEPEIRRAERRLLERGSGGGAVRVVPLYGALPRAAQAEALAPAPPGRRKVVLATSIAETSLTIEGVRAVVDGGLTRRPRFDPRSGMTRLETARVSRASADQRRGRAGRLGPGVCYRLWSEVTERSLAPFDPPEIAVADLAPLALDLAAWGVADPAAQLAWLDPPPAAAFDAARRLLVGLEALDGDGRITEHGRRMAGLGVHPRLAHMLLRAEALGLGGLACDFAALLDERDLVRAPSGQRDADLRARLDLLREPDAARRLPPGVALDRAAHRRAMETARELRRRLGLRAADRGDAPTSAAGLLLALAYPDRIAQRRPGGVGRFRLSNGRGAWLSEAEPLAAEDWLAVAELDGEAREARIFLAAPVTLAELREAFADTVRTVSFVRWDEREEAVAARRQERLGALVLADAPLPDPPPEEIAAAMLEGVHRLGLDRLPWTPELRQLRARVALLRRLDGPDAWPDLGDEALLAGLEDWLAPFLAGVTRRSQLDRIDLGAALRARIGWERRRALDELAPERLEVPSGSRPRLDYTSGEEPVLAVKLQETFGLTETPRIAGGRVPVTLHLLSPAGRPVQVTRDLAGFWAEGYAAVRRDLRGRYPRHPWPDDPLGAEPTARAKPRR